ncbi:MAG: glucuronate isomerase [Spirochaetes bacterium]|nr:glucuronate isomerase [Spirochaetota bacterium]
MTKKFIQENFLLTSKSAQKLYHEYAAHLPIIDYHCHLPVEQISNNHQFENLTQAWLYGDHYKWRAMRTNGVSEKYCTGAGTDEEKFLTWAKTVPHTLRNPLYHWTHLELARYFGLDEVLLGPDTAAEIYKQTSEMLTKPEFRVKKLLQKMNVKVICTTDDPLDNLEFHQQLAAEQFEIKIYPTFRPDKGMAVENPALFCQWVEKLEEITSMRINDIDTYLEALKKRHDFFHQQGCRISDHGLETFFASNYTLTEINHIFQKAKQKDSLNNHEIRQFKSFMMIEFGKLDADKNWTQQLHYGALRNINSSLYKVLGPDTGFDSMGDQPVARNLSLFLDKLEQQKKLPKTIIYNLNPADNEMIATMIGNFQDGTIAGKMQMGSGWWFLDQKDGMERQMNALSSLGLLSRFVGMLTDSRSFLSFPRHEYFRRVLCNLIGKDMENGEIPEDFPLVGEMISNICYHNAVAYFNF